MRRKYKIVATLLLLILFRLTFSFIVNDIVINNYERGIYDTSLIKTLYLFNFNQAYIPYYNEGNILYKEGNYVEALDRYSKSLEKHPPQSKVCDIRINQSLAMIKLIDSSDSESAYNLLEEAKRNLYMDNCASEASDDGKSDTAEELEDEIQELQDELNGSSSGTDSSDKNQDDEQQSEEEKEDYSDIEEALKEIEKNSASSRQSDLDLYKNWENTYYYKGKTW